MLYRQKVSKMEDEAQSYWRATAKPFEPPPAELPSRNDVVVVAVLAYGTYRVLGSSVGSLVGGVDSTLTTASPGASAAEATPKP